MKSVKVKVQQPTPTQEGPVIARFPGGAPPLEETDLEYLANQSSGPRQQGQRRLVAAVTNKCHYIGENFGKHSSSALDPCSYAIGVFDRETSTLTVHPVKDTYTMNLEVQTSTDVHEDTLSGMSNRSRRQLLVNSFGSRKRRRDQKAQEASQINSTNISGGDAVHALLKRTALDLGASAKTGTSQERAIARNRKEFLPPFDATTTEKSDVYKAEDLLLHKASLDKRVRKFSKLLKDGEAFAEARTAPRKNDLNSFLVKVIEQYHVSGGLPPVALKEKAQLMAMFSYLAKFHRMPHRMSGSSMDELAKKFFIPEPLLQRFSELFAEVDDSASQLSGGEGGKIRISKTDRLKDKLIVWMFAVALHLAEKFTCTTKELAADLELPSSKVSQYFKLLGCSTKANQAKLNAPPVFPRKSRGRK